MPPPGSDALRRIFDLAVEAPAAARQAILDRECAGNPELRACLEAMLASFEPTSSPGAAPDPARPATFSLLAANPTSERSTASSAPLREGPGTRIGSFKILQQIGEGGFGVVFMAEQETPVRRRVALKIIKLGMDTRSVIARFEAERQALAMMDHPNIARVLDAGSTNSGRPFFVMELVKGEPITEYADRNNLDIPERLELFEQVCRAVQHAHTKGVIHRDLKPSNILVSTQDGRPHAKVIDFGIAKATDHRLTEKTLFTEHKALIGTPEYMSPEQAEGSLDIDTRTDVYSLGVLLYELLTGSTPFDGKTLRDAGYAEIQRIIREVEPPKPSTRLSQSGDTLPAVAQHRRSEPRKLGLIVRGELDWIVMKSLEKDRARRYETANAFAMDVGRYLAGEPVYAAPPGAGYRFRKFVKRNKERLFAVAVVILLLATAGAGIASWVSQQKRADAAERAAKVKEAEREREAMAREAELAKETAAKAKEAADFKAALEREQTRSIGFRDSPADQVVLAKLDSKRVTLTGDDLPLTRALSMVSDQIGVSIEVDWKSLESAGIVRTIPVSIGVRNVTGDTALRAIMAGARQGGVEPVFETKEGKIRVTSPEAMRRDTLLAEYDCTFFFPERVEDPQVLARRVQMLKDLIESNVDSEGWQDRGGDTSTMQEVDGRLIVKTTLNNHREIEAFLQLLRTGGLRTDAERTRRPAIAANDVALLDRMASIHFGIRMLNEPLRAAMKSLTERTGIQIIIDPSVARKADEAMVTCDLPDQWFIELLPTLLGREHCTFSLRFDVVDGAIVLGPDFSRSRCVAEVFNVEGILAGSPREQGWRDLIDAVEDAVDPLAWQDRGGDLATQQFFGTNLLVSAPRQMVYRVGDVLARMEHGARPRRMDLADRGDPSVDSVQADVLCREAWSAIGYPGPTRAKGVLHRVPPPLRDWKWRAVEALINQGSTGMSFPRMSGSQSRFSPVCALANHRLVLRSNAAWGVWDCAAADWTHWFLNAESSSAFGSAPTAGCYTSLLFSEGWSCYEFDAATGETASPTWDIGDSEASGEAIIGRDGSHAAFVCGTGPDQTTQQWVRADMQSRSTQRQVLERARSASLLSGSADFSTMLARVKLPDDMDRVWIIRAGQGTPVLDLPSPEEWGYEEFPGALDDAGACFALPFAQGALSAGDTAKTGVRVSSVVGDFERCRFFLPEAPWVIRFDRSGGRLAVSAGRCLEIRDSFTGNLICRIDNSASWLDWTGENSLVSLDQAGALREWDLSVLPTRSDTEAATALLDRMRKEGRLPADVGSAIEQDPTLSPSVRRAALDEALVRWLQSPPGPAPTEVPPPSTP